MGGETGDSVGVQANGEVRSVDFPWRSPGSAIKFGPNGLISRRGNGGNEVDMVVRYVPEQLSITSDNYCWTFTFLEDDNASIDVGFICVPRGEYGLINDIGQKSLRDFPGTKIVCLDTKERMISVSRDEPKSYWRNWEHFPDMKMTECKDVRFTFSEPRRTCHLSVGDCFGGPGWEDLPTECTYLPAICFNHGSSGKLQLRYNWY